MVKIMTTGPRLIGPRSGPTKSWPGMILIKSDTEMVYLKEFFENVCFEKNQQTTNSKKNIPGAKVKMFLPLSASCYPAIEFLVVIMIC